jgi:hypothetical protein
MAVAEEVVISVELHIIISIIIIIIIIVPKFGGG